MRSTWLIFLGVSLGVGMSLIGSRIGASLAENSTKAGSASAGKKEGAKSSGEAPSERGPSSLRRADLDRPIVWESDRSDLEAQHADGGLERHGTRGRDPERIPSPEQLAAEHLAEHDALIKGHRDEVRDRRWAGMAETALQEKLNDIGRDKFKTLEVDCRSTTCTAKLEWPTYTAAVGEYWDVLHFANAVRCQREMILPPPADVQAPYQATVVMTNCSRSESNPQ